MDSGVSRSNEGGSKDERSSRGERAHRSFCLLRKVGVSAARCDVPTYVHTRVDPRANNCQMKIYLFANTPLKIRRGNSRENSRVCCSRQMYVVAVAAARERHISRAHVLQIIPYLSNWRPSCSDIIRLTESVDWQSSTECIQKREKFR